MGIKCYRRALQSPLCKTENYVKMLAEMWLLQHQSGLASNKQAGQPLVKGEAACGSGTNVILPLMLEFSFASDTDNTKNCQPC